MPEHYEQISREFTTADTEGPVVIKFEGDKLTVEFRNFRTPLQRVVFSDVRAFSWTDWNNAPTGARPDEVYRVTGSTLLAPFERSAVGEKPFAHYKLGFCAEGKWLDVVATTMQYKRPD